VCACVYVLDDGHSSNTDEQSPALSATHTHSLTVWSQLCKSAYV